MLASSVIKSHILLVSTKQGSQHGLRAGCSKCNYGYLASLQFCRFLEVLCFNGHYCSCFATKQL